VTDWYTPHSPLTEPGAFASEFDGLGEDVASLMTVVQGLVLHPADDDHWLWTDERRLRFVGDMLAYLREQDHRPLAEAREPARRVHGNCRQSAVLLVALLRQRRVPARKRTGFARYIAPGRAIIHEIAEARDVATGRWALADAEFPLSRQWEVRAADGFVTGGDAWLRCRSGRADPNEFQFTGGEGLRLVRQALLQDLDGLNRVELLSHDWWGGDLDVKPIEELTADDLDWLDRAAELTLAADERQDELRRFYADSARCRTVVARVAEAAEARGHADRSSLRTPDPA
jgi:hypothetical protein